MFNEGETSFIRGIYCVCYFCYQTVISLRTGTVSYLFFKFFLTRNEVALEINLKIEQNQK